MEIKYKFHCYGCDKAIAKNNFYFLQTNMNTYVWRCYYCTKAGIKRNNARPWKLMFSFIEMCKDQYLTEMITNTYAFPAENFDWKVYTRY